MAWIIINASLSVSARSMSCEGGSITATITVTGRTDEAEVVNSYEASLRDDYVIPDILWKSGPQTAGASAEVKETFTVELSCNKRGRVVGPNGSSHERTAELYAYVIGGGREGASDEVPVTCTRK